MASKRRVRAKACDGKVRHASQQDAQHACFLTKKRLSEWLIAYKCKFCKGWHVGHPPRRVRVAIHSRVNR